MPERIEQTCWAVWVESKAGSRWMTNYGSVWQYDSADAARQMATWLTIPGQVATAVKVRVTVEPLEEPNDG